MGVGRSSMSITVRRLRRKGYIRCKHDGKDARCVRLTLTVAGARVREENTLLDPELVRELFGFMSTAKLETALQGLEALAKAANSALRRRSRRRNG